jgi:hypothetical protein
MAIEQCSTAGGSDAHAAHMLAGLTDLRERRRQDQSNGVPALGRLLHVAQGHGGQGKVIAGFLLSCYNGTRFKFDLTDFRLLDSDLFDDCLAVLRMDNMPVQEVHCYFQDGGRIFEALAKDWGIRDFTKKGARK